MATGKISPLRRSTPLLLLLLLSLLSSTEWRCEAQSLPQQEVNALRQIASKLKKDWDFSVNPCSGKSGWVEPPHPNIYGMSNLTCDCNITSNVCHVISIMLTGQNLTGVLPDEFANLTHLSNLQLTENYLSGTIPKTWASLPLTTLVISGNRISGNIPDELGNITTLQNLGLEANQLQGPLPPSLGKLTHLKRFFASSNNLSGELPQSLGNLKNISLFYFDGNPISGKFPSFIGNWTRLEQLDLQGTLLEGPFPPIFSTLTSITVLRVSDWKGGDGKFPALHNMMAMQELVLRNLSISGQLPDYLGNMMTLRFLDLSFNNLMGPIPRSLDLLADSINYMFLTNNMLSGVIPAWILSSKQNLDLSYNMFTGPLSVSSCEQGNVNLVASYSSTNNNSIRSCFRKGLPCSIQPRNYNVFINCGGRGLKIGDEEYEQDTSQLGASIFQISNSGKWAYSSTGYFMNSGQTNYIATNASLLNMTNPELYMNARLSPLSLRYYGLCLESGNYTVSLHFAEIMFTHDQTYSSVGERIFDVLIQGEKVLHDFNIAKEANGTGQEIVKNFTTIVNSSSSTLEIHFQWTGKGTKSIPHRGVYGPLISAISVTPNFKPDTGDGHHLSVGAIISIAVASCVVILLVFVFLWICFKRKGSENSELGGIQLPTGYFSLKQIKTATRNFDPQNKIGEGGFGPVYKGVLQDGSLIAVKQLSSKSKQGNREFINEIGMISALQHPNLVKLFGCCVEGNELLVIYEYMENNNLARALFGPERSKLTLDWQTRRKICLGIARGLAYLHEESRLKIVHRDIKATNILLDKDLNAKISDFGLAKLDDEENTHINTRIAGTLGYMAPEYAMRGYLTDKADVYSFGVVMLEIVSGMSNTRYRPKEDCVYLLDWAYVLQKRGNLMELVDPNLGSNYSKAEAEQMLNLSLVCTNPSPTLRPTMSTIVSMFEGKTIVQVPPVKRVPSGIQNMRFNSSQKPFEKNLQESQTHSISMAKPITDSSVSSQSNKENSASYYANSQLLSDERN